MNLLGLWKAIKLEGRIEDLYRAGKYEQAIELANELCGLVRKSRGPDHWRYADALEQLARFYETLKVRALAVPLFHRAITIRCKALGKDHHSYSPSVREIATIYLRQHDTTTAEEFNSLIDPAPANADKGYEVSEGLAALQDSVGRLQQAAAATGYKQDPLSQLEALRRIDREALGPDSLQLAAALESQGYIYDTAPRLDEAESLFLESLEIRRRVSPRDDPGYLAALMNLARFYLQSNRPQLALSYAEETLQICESEGLSKEVYATLLKELANIKREMGSVNDLREAEELLTRAWKLQLQLVGEEDEQTVDTMNNLGVVHLELGDRVSAAPLLRRAVELRRALLAPDDPALATSIRNLAKLHEHIGDTETANAGYLEATQIQLRRAEKEDPALASLLNAQIRYSGAPDDPAAEETLLQELAEFHRRAGSLHNYAENLNSLASFYSRAGQRTLARELSGRAVDLRRVEAGERHPDYATALNNLAGVLVEDGDFAEAKRLYQQALSISEQDTGSAVLLRESILRNLALLHMQLNEAKEALRLMQEAAALDDQLIDQVFSFATERQRLSFLEKQQGNFDAYLSLVCQHFRQSPDVVCSAFELVLRRKGISAEVFAMQRDAVISGRFPNLKTRLAELSALRWELVQKDLKGPTVEGVAQHNHERERLRQEKEKLEAELAAVIPELRLSETLRAADLQAVAHALPEDSALIEFVRYLVFRVTKASISFEHPRYAAFVLTARVPDAVKFIDLGEADFIDRLINRFRTTVTRAGHSGGAVDEPEIQTASGGDEAFGVELRKLVFDPIVKTLNETRRLILAPDGELMQLPFEVLPAAQSGYLLDHYAISYVGLGRDLLRFGAESSARVTAPLVIADPDFDLCNAEVDQCDTERFNRSAARLSRDLKQNNLRFARLPGTRVEGQAVARLMGVEPWLAEAALEGPLKQRHSPRILHLATHGFFLPNQQHESEYGLLNLEAPTPFSRKGLENPLLRSGLVLSGANAWLNDHHVPLDAEDGILTAEDVSGLDLTGTELVVLSACESGLGDILVGEGMFGLRRAFVLAGARTLVMSLWKVSDLATAILMGRFYENLSKRGLGRDAALRKAQLYTRDVTVGEIRNDWLRTEMIEELAGGDHSTVRYLKRLSRKDDDHQPFHHPYFWGAFICQGDFNPISQREGDSVLPQA